MRDFFTKTENSEFAKHKKEKIDVRDKIEEYSKNQKNKLFLYIKKMSDGKMDRRTQLNCVWEFHFF